MVTTHTDRQHEDELAGLREHSLTMGGIADHTTNIDEMVVFMVKGKSLRHLDVPPGL